MSNLPIKLQTIVEEFSLLEGREKLEYLLELADRLPPLREWLGGCSRSGWMRPRPR